MKVADILAAKGDTVVTIKPTDTMAAFSRLISRRKIGAAVVSSDGRAVEGVISERDLAYNLDTHGGKLHAMPVSSLMTRAVISCGPHDEVSFVASTMLSRNIRHLPVIERGALVGMVSIRDVLKVEAGALAQEAAMLRSLVNNEAGRELQDR